MKELNRAVTTLKSPYKKLLTALTKAGAKRMWQFEAFKNNKFVDFDLELWRCGSRQFLVQHWVQYDGWVAYIEQDGVSIDECIAELVGLKA